MSHSPGELSGITVGHCTFLSPAALKMAVLETIKMGRSTNRPTMRKIGLESRCQRVAMRQMVWLSILAISYVFIWRRGLVRQAHTATAAVCTCRRTAARHGDRRWKKIVTFTTLRLTRVTRRYFMPQDLNHPPGDRATVASTGAAYPDLTLNGVIAL